MITMSLSARRPRTSGPVFTILIAALALGLPAVAVAQQAEVEEATVTLSASQATLTLDMAEGADRSIELRGGVVRIDGVAVAEYESGGSLDNSWRDFLRGSAALDAGSLPAALREFGAAAGESQAADELRATFDEVLGGAVPASETVQVDAPTVTEDRLTIAPGALSVEALTRRLERLDHSLSGLGEDVPHSDELALVVHDDYTIPEGTEIAGNVALLDGTLSLLGTIEGDVLVLDGELLVEPSGRIDGSVLQVGGDVERLGGRIAGELRSLMRRGPAIAIAPAPEVDADVVADVWTPAPTVRHRGFFGAFWHNVGHAFEGLFATLTFWLGLGLLGALAVYFQRPRFEVIADTARQNIARSFAVGLTGQFLFFPILLVLVVAIITWLVVPLYLLAVGLALVVGYLAVAHATGEALAGLRYEGLAWLRRSNSYYYVLSGLAALLGLFAVAAVLEVFGGLLNFLQGLAIVVGVALTWFAISTGFGAVILSRAGTRSDYVWRARSSSFDRDTDYPRRESAGA